MKKTVNLYKSYIQLSHAEEQLLNAVEPLAVFSLSTIQKLLGWKHSKISNTLLSLKRKKIISAVKKDNYVVIAKIPENLFAIAIRITAPSYISLWTALSYYGYTEQQVKTVQVISTKQYPLIIFKNQRIESVTVLPRSFFGYQKIQNFCIAEKEKLLLDCLSQIERVGGIEEYTKCLTAAWNEINQAKLLQYLYKLNIKSLFARLGYLLEILQLKNDHEKEFLEQLPLSFVKLEPGQKESKKYNKKWKVITND